MKRPSLLEPLPTLLRIGFAEAVAYRAEMLVWVLATTMPLLMMALWTSVADDAPVGRYGKPEFVAYFLAMFVVRQLTGSWAFYDINFEVRNGTLGMRLLRPIHPLFTYAVEGIAAMPMRFIVSLPVALVALFTAGARALTHQPVMWELWGLSLVGAWLITLFSNLVIGCMSFYVESSMKLMDAWLVFFFIFGGYVVPVDLFPPGLRTLSDWLPFRYQLGLPVELILGAHSTKEALLLLAGQWAWALIGFCATALVWRGGLRRFVAHGG